MQGLIASFASVVDLFTFAADGYMLHARTTSWLASVLNS